MSACPEACHESDEPLLYPLVYRALSTGARQGELLGLRLRHSAASYLAMSGATLAEIAEVLGLKTLAMVKRYSHMAEQHTAEVVARMNQRFLAELAASPPSSEAEGRIMREVLK